MKTCSIKTTKYILLTFNFIFCIAAIGIIIAGTLVLSDVSEFKHFLEGRILVPPVILIITGTIIFIIAFLGSYGAIKENYRLLMVFGTSVLIIFMIEIAIIIVVMIFKSDVDIVMRESLKESMIKYSDSESDKMAWDVVQRKFNCCGTDASTDWQKIDANHFARGLPASCCKDTAVTTCANSQFEAYQAGCFSELVAKVQKNVKLLIGISFGIAFIEIAGMALAFLLGYTLKKEGQSQ